jgi:nicotinate-nucleotide adenylyltransferase
VADTAGALPEGAGFHTVRIGFLGGSFDPIHLGHLLIAQDALEGLGLDRLDFIPAAVSPLKARALTASPAQRLEMVRLAIEGDERFGILDLELRRGGTSYTVDTVRELGRRFPGAELFWVLGTDQVQLLAGWKDIGELVALVEFVHLARPGLEGVVVPPIPGLRLHRVAGHEVAISSSELRARVSQGLPLRHFVPLKVADFIESQSLYRPNS